MAENKIVHNYELMYLAGGLALGVGLGLILSNREVRTNVKNSLSHVIPHSKGIAWPLGVMTIGGTLAAGAASIAPDVARYIKISNM
jgi:hypothetical protein